jgi:hypothetical protein
MHSNTTDVNATSSNAAFIIHINIVNNYFMFTYHAYNQDFITMYCSVISNGYAARKLRETSHSLNLAATHPTPQI